MKRATLAPAYACLYPGLCDIARKHGYALAIHGTMERDLDLVAIPWTYEATDAGTLAQAIKEHIGAVLYPELLSQHAYLTREHIEAIVARAGGRDPSRKPHGRLAWSLHLECGAYVDLSVLPRRARDVGEVDPAPATVEKSV